jgi:hypothetical protein
MPPKPEDLTLTNPHGSLTALYIIPGEKICGKPAWMCRCVCGREHKAMSSCLKRGDVKSCGKCGAGGRGKYDRVAAGIKKPVNVRETKRELRVDPDMAAYEEKPLTNRFRKRRPMTVEEIAIKEARYCGAGQYNF